MLLNNIRKSADNGKLTVAVFIVLSIAFNTLGHSKLLAKLKTYGLDDIELEWYINYLFGRAQTVKVNETLFKPDSVFCGVLLGLILGLAIFLIFLNNFPRTATNCETIQFADDSVNFVSYKDVDSIEFMLNEDLKSVYSYFVKI